MKIGQILEISKKNAEWYAMRASGVVVCVCVGAATDSQYFFYFVFGLLSAALSSQVNHFGELLTHSLRPEHFLYNTTLS